MLIVIGLGLSAVGGGMTFLPQNHFDKGFGRTIRIGMGWLLILWGLSLSGYTTYILIQGKSTEQATMWFGGAAHLVPKIVPTPRPKARKETEIKKQNETQASCEAVSIWFNDSQPQPEFNIYPDSKDGDTLQPKLELKFYVDCFNKTNEERDLTFLPYLQGGNLPANWKVIGVGIYQISGAEKDIPGPKIVVAPKTHFLFNALVEIGTEDMNTPAFYESFKTLSEKVTFTLTVKTEEDETCTTAQTISIRDGFRINFEHNHQDITKNWSN